MFLLINSKEQITTYMCVIHTKEIAENVDDKADSLKEIQWDINRTNIPETFIIS